MILQLVNRFETFFLLIFQYKYLKSCSEDFYLIRPQGTTRVPGLGQITWRIVLTKKMRVHLGKKLHENREIASDWAVGVWVHRNSWLGAKIGASPETKNKHSKIAFAVTSSALTLGHLGPRLLGFAAQSPIWSPGTLFPYINMNSLNFFVTIRYQLPKGKLAGLALKYYWFKKPQFEDESIWRVVRDCDIGDVTHGRWQLRTKLELRNKHAESKGASSGRPDFPISVSPAACRARPSAIATKNAHFAFLAIFGE